MEIEILPFKNAAEVAKLYGDLPDRLIKKAMRQALRKSARPSFDQAKANLRNLRREARRTERVTAQFHKAETVSITAFQSLKRVKEGKRRGFASAEDVKTAKRSFLRSNKALHRKRAEFHRRRKFDTHTWTGRLLKSGKIEIARPSNRKLFGSIVSFSARSLRGRSKAPYAYFLEEGHGIGKRSGNVMRLARRASALRRQIGKSDSAQSQYNTLRRKMLSSDTRGKVPPYPFLGPAFTTKLSATRAIITSEWKANLEREATLHRAKVGA